MTKKFVMFAFVLICLTACGSSSQSHKESTALNHFANAYLETDSAKQLQFNSAQQRLTLLSEKSNDNSEAENFRKEVLAKILSYQVETVTETIPAKGKLVIALEIDTYTYNIAQNDRLSVYANGLISLHSQGKTAYYRLSENDVFQFINHVRTLEEIFLNNHTIAS